MAEPKTQIFYINLGGTVANLGSIRYAWRGRKDSYKNINSQLGVNLAKDTDKGLFFGANSPSPARVRLYYTNNSGQSASTVRFCEPDKLSSVTTGGTLNGKKVKVGSTEFSIYRVELVTG